MPTAGVASHFMDLLGAEHATSRRRSIVLLVVVLLLAAPAFLIAGWQGLVVHALGALAGIIVGNLRTRSRVTRYEGSLRATWKAWMRWSMSSESVPEVHRRVHGHPRRNLPWWTAALLTTSWALEVGLLALAFANEGTLAWAVPVLVLNGLVPAAFAGHFLRLGGWVRQLKQSLTDLVQDGELGVWGVA